MMKTITVDLYTFEHQELHIGRVGENLHVRFVIDVSEYVNGMSAPSVAMTIENANGLRYPGTAFLDGTDVVWTILGGDLVADGVGYAQLTIMDGEEIVKSATATTVVEPSLTADGEMPDPIEDFVEHAGEVMDTILGVESRVTQIAIGADVARYGAETAQGKAEDAQRSAEAARNSADFASREAMAAKGEAQAAQLNAEAAASAAQTAQGKAEDAQEAAEDAQAAAVDAKTEAEVAQAAAESAQAGAEAAQAGAEAAIQTALDGLIDDTSTEADHVWSAQKVSTVTGGKMDANLKGASGGVAELDANGKVPSAQLPSYVDDVVEYATRNAFPGTGESGKIYVALDTNTTYRWTGATYAGVGSSLALGETESTAYRGDRGKAAYDAAVANPDAAPTEGSNDLVKSGGVYTALELKANKSNPVFTGSVSMGRKANTVRGTNSTVLGSYVEASGKQSQAFGTQTVAAGDHQMVSGFYNVADSMDNVEAFVPNKQYRKGEVIKYSSNGGSTYKLYIFKEDYSGASLNMYKVNQLLDGMTKNIRIIGNGTSAGERRNAHTLDWGGNAEFAGDVKAQACGGANPVSLVETAESLSGKANVLNPQFTGYMSLGRKSGTTAGAGSIALGSDVEASGEASFAEGAGTKAAGTDDHAEGYMTETAGGGQPGNHAEGWKTKATGGAAHAENSQTTASGNSSHAEGILTTASAQAAHAEGIQTTASKAASHTEGQGTTASGEESHAEGLNTTASGPCSHAEGLEAKATAQGGHAEGINTLASGMASHAEGLEAKATGVASHAGGRYNIPDSIDDYPLWVSGTHYYVGDIVRKTASSIYPSECITENSDTDFTSSKWRSRQYLKHAEVIGNGTADNARSNARTLTWEGTEEVAGDVIANGCGGANPVSLVETAASVAGKYTKPQGGIPKTDLASGVQTSLEKADTAYQKPDGGIPASDIADGVIPDPEDLIDDTAGDGDTDKVWSADKSAGEVSTLSSALNEKSESKTSDAQGVDLDITDENGNVIVRFEDGHIKTKEFDSSDLPSGSGSAETRGSDSTADLVLTDNVGNVIAQFSDGHIQTKNFNSEDAADSMEVVHRISGDDYVKTFSYDNSTATEQTITGDFRQGDIILCHFSNVANDLTDTSTAKYIQYYYVTSVGQTVFLGKDYGYCFGRFTLPADAVGIKASIPSGMLSTGTFTCKFLVYRLGKYEREPNIITVGTADRCMFTSLRAAMDSFTDNNWYNRYEIWIYPGTYNILNDYTDAEIRTEGFVGLWVKNGVKLKGIGHRNEIILHGELDNTEYSSTIRNAISTLNLSGDCGLENITVTNKYLRYAVHDDHASGIYQEQTKLIENCKFVSTDAASGGFGQAAFGAGGNSGKTLIIRNCDLGDRLIIHNYQNQSVPMTAIVENSFARIVNITDNNNQGFTAKTRVSFHNCDFTLIRHMMTSHGTEPSMFLEGTGTHDAMVMTEAGIVYDFGDCRKFLGTSLSVGQAVKLDGSMMPVAQTDETKVYGIVIGNDGKYTFVQTRGYISDILLGLTGLSVGDYITIDSSGMVTATGATASNAIGYVACEDTTDSCVFIKLLF